MRHRRYLVIRQEHGGGVELLPLASVDFDGGYGAVAQSGEEELLLTEADGVELLEFLNRGRDVGYQRKAVGAVEVFKEAAHEGGGGAEGVVAEVDGQVVLIDVAAALGEGVVHAEALREGQEAEHGPAGVVELAEPIVGEDHAGFAGGPMPAVDPGAVGPKPLGLFIYVVIGGIVGEDKVIGAKAGQ